MSKRNKAKDMERLLARRRRQGLTWDELSEETGISKGTLCWWGRRLRATRAARDQSEFVEVTVGGSQTAALPTAVEIVLRNGRFLRVVPGFDAEHLARVIGVVESGC